jgi:hypothetical protein
MSKKLIFQIEFIPGLDYDHKTFQTGNYSVFGIKLKMTRIRSPFILQTYMPCTLFVFVSWISFVMPLNGGERAGSQVFVFLSVL